ncbi:MAG: hypothetical protein JST52_07700 [Bacteroidetes bacterium]|nr:hypothetical protein [Bacteroidota bacterium]MBS1741144.1 hypothetical protein [Bacteroidota bacterium]MBS1776313.1 hypothetical protein [Bacteroidota bacterium]
MKLKSLLLFATLFFSFVCASLKAQSLSDSLSMLLDEPTDKIEAVTGTFATTRLANGQSIENVEQGVLDFRVNHRFGLLTQGFKDFFGLDGANTRIGFDYGITNWLMIGIGRSSYFKEYDGFAKVKILRQKTGNAMPVSVSYLGAISVLGIDHPTLLSDSIPYRFINRLAYVNQLIIARKWNESVSLQIMPTHVHYNLVNYLGESNDVLAVGLGGRVKLSSRMALVVEYYYQFEGTKRFREGIPGTTTKNPLTIGLDIQTGGHVFQLLFSNSQAVSERNMIGQTTDDWGKGDIHFGFNISRVFTIVRPKEFSGSRNKIW